MIYVAKKKNEKPLNVDVPQALWDEIARVTGNFQPFKKKHFIAAALATFLELDAATQYEDMVNMLRKYYQKKTNEATTQADDPGGDAVQRGLDRAARLKKRSAKGSG